MQGEIDCTELLVLAIYLDHAVRHEIHDFDAVQRAVNDEVARLVKDDVSSRPFVNIVHIALSCKPSPIFDLFKLV